MLEPLEGMGWRISWKKPCHPVFLLPLDVKKIQDGNP